MINSISEFIAKRWVYKSVISEEDYELYHYGWFVILSDLWLFFVTLTIGIFFNITIPSIVFFVTFFVIRRFAGGFHAKTELHCQIISLSFLFLSLVGIKYMLFEIESIYLIIINMICVIILPIISPADTPQKVLSSKEKKKFKIITMFISFGFTTINILTLYCKLNFVSAAIVCAFVLETILVVFGRLLNFRMNDL